MEGLLDEARDEIAAAHTIIDNWERDYNRLQRRLNIQPYVMLGHGIGFTVGGTFLGMGLVGMSGNTTFSDAANNRNLAIGAATIGTTTLVYILGRCVFKWW